MNNFGMSENIVSVSLPKDESGLTGRECPRPECEGYFKVKSGTGLIGESLPCYCPYCGVPGPSDHFYTKEQIEYARSIVFKSVSDNLFNSLKKLETRRSSLSIRVSRDAQIPIRHYREKQLETEIICENCTLQYSVFGVFAFCPDCGKHNTLQILKKNLILAEKLLALSQEVDRDMSRHLLENALEDCVSSFDGFGRSLFQIASKELSENDRSAKVSFQNLKNANQTLKAKFAIDMESLMESGDWKFLVTSFQKRHLLAHSMGVVDEEYLSKTSDQSATIGRKIPLDIDSISRLSQLLSDLGEKLTTAVHYSKQDDK